MRFFPAQTWVGYSLYVKGTSHLLLKSILLFLMKMCVSLEQSLSSLLQPEIVSP